MKTGIVIEIHKKKATIFMNGGAFVDVKANPIWEIGDVVSIKSKVTAMRNFISAAAVFVFLIIGFMGHYFYLSEAALMSIDVNPSFEITFNRLNRVIAAKDYNQDGQELLASMDLKNKTYSEAVSLLFQNDMFQKYLKKNTHVEFAVQSSIQSRDQDMVAELKTLPFAKKNIVSYNIVDKKTVNEAHKYNTTPGKYALVRELEKKYSDIDVDEYLQLGISEIYQDTELNEGDPNSQLPKENLTTAQNKQVQEDNKKPNNKSTLSKKRNTKKRKAQAQNQKLKSKNNIVPSKSNEILQNKKNQSKTIQPIPDPIDSADVSADNAAPDSITETPSNSIVNNDSSPAKKQSNDSGSSSESINGTITIGTDENSTPVENATDYLAPDDTSSQDTNIGKPTDNSNNTDTKPKDKTKDIPKDNPNCTDDKPVDTIKDKPEDNTQDKPKDNNREEAFDDTNNSVVEAPDNIDELLNLPDSSTNTSQYYIAVQPADEAVKRRNRKELTKWTMQQNH